MQFTIKLPRLDALLATLATLSGVVLFILGCIATQGGLLAATLTGAVAALVTYGVYQGYKAAFEAREKVRAMTPEQKAKYEEQHRYDW